MCDDDDRAGPAPPRTWSPWASSRRLEALDNTLAVAVNKQLPYPEMLAELLGVDVTARRERYLTTKTRMAYLPFQPSNDERLLKELANPGLRRRGH